MPIDDAWRDATGMPTTIGDADLGDVVSAVDRAGVGVIVESRDGTSRFVNASARRLLDLFPDCLARVRAAASGAGRVSDGATTFDFSRSKLADGSTVLVLRDVSGQVKADRRHAALERHLRDNSPALALGHMAGGLAHDFNNLVGTIMGFVTFLLEDLDPDSEAHAHAERIARAARRARQLLVQISAAVGRDDLPPPQRLNDIVQDSLAIAETMLPPRARIEAQIAAAELRAAIDPAPFMQMIVALCVHAHEVAASAGGAITLSVERVAEGDPLLRRLQQPAKAAVEVEASAGGAMIAYAGTLAAGRSYAAISVRENVGGISPGDLQGLFDPFAAGVPQKFRFELFVMQRLILAHEGALIVAADAHSAAFTIFLPLQPEIAAAPAKPPASAAAGRPTGPVRVLVIDDDIDFGDMVSTTLDRAGYEVAVCDDPLQGLAIFEEAPHTWDVIVVDQSMPALTGSELIQRVKNRHSGPVCILCTAHPGAAMDASQAHAAGAEGFFRKPVNAAELVSLVASLTTAGVRTPPA